MLFSAPSMKLFGWTCFLGFGLSLLLGCSAFTPAIAPPSAGDPSSPSSSSMQSSPFRGGQGQILPITAQVDVEGQVIQLEVAQTPRQQQMGLMYRTELPADRGMVFVFNPPRSIQFWMKNTLIPLDMVFLQNGEVKAIVAEAPPCTTNPCPTYGPSNVAVDQVIELAAGRAAELNLKPGDRLSVQFLSN